MRRQKYFVILIGILCLTVSVTLFFEHILSTAWYDYEISLRVRTLLDLNDTHGYTGKKKILLWNTMFGEKWFYVGKSGLQFENCPRYKNCYTTRYRGLVNEDDFDAILFHGNEINRYDLPEKRRSFQKYVFVNLESPINGPLSDPFFVDYFNLTMTYRLDSDIPWPYYVVKNISNGEIVAPFRNVVWTKPYFDSVELKNPEFGIDGKNKIAAWFVSNCDTFGNRELYVDELKKYIKVDVIGRCGNYWGPRCSISRDCFKEIIDTEYFFYLAFENTLCEDYVTEKFSKALSHNVIPVVYGGANYSLFAPPHSYIDALDYESPRELANYLIKLSHSREEYSKYFWWKKVYKVDHVGSEIMCRLCELLNIESKHSKTFSALIDWYSKDKCPIQDVLNPLNFATKELRSRTINNNW